MIYGPDAPSDPLGRLAYLTERAGLLAEMREGVERGVHAQEQRLYRPAEGVVHAQE